jgi:cytoskeletal protein RodZ
MPETTRKPYEKHAWTTKSDLPDSAYTSPRQRKEPRPDAPDVAETLRRARLDQGLDLATVTARTKIKAKYLEAIEAGDRKSLPGGLYYKSFIHQYAMFLGLDTGEIDAASDRVFSGDVPLPLPTEDSRTAVKLCSLSRPARTYSSYAALVLTLVAGLGIDGWWHRSRTLAIEKIESRAPVVVNTKPRGTPRPAKGPASLALVSQVAPEFTVATPAATAARQDEPAAPANSRVQLDLTATEETWLSVSSDGSPVFSGILVANQTKTIESKQYAKLRVGNAAGLEVRLNGKPLGPLGAHGQVRVVVCTPDRLQFVSTSNEGD